jgi:hypothetical protein
MPADSAAIYDEHHRLIALAFTEERRNHNGHSMGRRNTTGKKLAA